jgi:hypothetical protein
MKLVVLLAMGNDGSWTALTVK